jgi:hypothetical protein
MHMVGRYVMEGEVEEHGKEILKKIQGLMDQAGVSKFAIDLFSKVNSEEILDASLNLLIEILKYSNFKIQKSILKILKSGERNMKLFIYIKDRIALGYTKTQNSYSDNSTSQLRRIGDDVHSEKVRSKYNCYNVLELIKLF